MKEASALQSSRICNPKGEKKTPNCFGWLYRSFDLGF
jgi:hypothetical protein